MRDYNMFLHKQDRTEEEQARYNMHLMSSLGAETMDEALAIVKAAGI